MLAVPSSSASSSARIPSFASDFSMKSFSGGEGRGDISTTKTTPSGSGHVGRRQQIAPPPPLTHSYRWPQAEEERHLNKCALFKGVLLPPSLTFVLVVQTPVGFLFLLLRLHAPPQASPLRYVLSSWFACVSDVKSRALSVDYRLESLNPPTNVCHLNRVYFQLFNTVICATC